MNANDEDRMIRFFSNHLTPISITFEKDGDEQVSLITAFAMKITEHWFVITAGHVVDDVIQPAISAGYRIKKSYLIDSLGTNAVFREPIPFPIDLSTIIHPIDIDTFDYGVIPLSSYYQLLLMKNGITPIDEEAWKKQPDSFDYYRLLGIPESLVDSETFPGYINIGTIFLDVELVKNRPEKFTETEYPLFYGKIKLSNGLTDIKGVSGGPIFGFRIDKQGEMRYWLVALQSKWLRYSHFIKACPTKLLGEAVERTILREGD